MPRGKPIANRYSIENLQNKRILKHLLREKSLNGTNFISFLGGGRNFIFEGERNNLWQKKGKPPRSLTARALDIETCSQICPFC